MYKDFLLNRN